MKRIEVSKGGQAFLASAGAFNIVAIDTLSFDFGSDGLSALWFTAGISVGLYAFLLFLTKEEWMVNG